MMNFTNSYDNKIMNWDKEDFDALVASITDEEIESMISVLDNCQGFDICAEYWEDAYEDEEGRKYDIVSAYIKRWLYSQIEENIISGTRELFEIVMAI